MTTEQPGSEVSTVVPSFLLAQPSQVVPDYYTDAFRVAASAYSVSLYFAVQMEQNFIQDKVVVRMSPQHAKMMAILFMRIMKQYERDVGEIPIPEKILAEKQVDLARDWNAV